MAIETDALRESVSAGLQNPFADSFRSSVEALCVFACREGMSLTPYLDPRLSKFNALPIEHQAGLAQSMRDYVEILSSFKDKEETLGRNLNTLWFALRQKGLRGSDDLFELLQPEDIVEVYSLSGTALFRSFHFFQLCSYDLETMHCTPWYELFERDREIDSLYMSYFGRAVAGNIRETEAVKVSEHLVREKFAPKQFVTRLKPLWIGPLRDQKGALQGFIHASRGELVESAVGIKPRQEPSLS